MLQIPILPRGALVGLSETLEIGFPSRAPSLGLASADSGRGEMTLLLQEP